MVDIAITIMIGVTLTFLVARLGIGMLIDGAYEKD
jgi:hypothetical protein